MQMSTFSVHSRTKEIKPNLKEQIYYDVINCLLIYSASCLFLEYYHWSGSKYRVLSIFKYLFINRLISLYIIVLYINLESKLTTFWRQVDKMTTLLRKYHVLISISGCNKFIQNMIQNWSRLNRKIFFNLVLIITKR